MAGPTSDTSAVIQVRGLTKSYGDVRAVAGIDLRIARGEVFALLGPNGAGKTVVLTTHYMDEAQHLADRVAVMADGRIVAEGAPATLAGRDATRPRVSYKLPDGATPPPDLGGPPSPEGDVEFAPEDLTLGLHRLTGWALENSASLRNLHILRPSLEDVYLQLTSSTTPTPPAGGGPATDRTPR